MITVTWWNERLIEVLGGKQDYNIGFYFRVPEYLIGRYDGGGLRPVKGLDFTWNIAKNESKKL